MRIWLVTVGEPVPVIDAENPRLLRTGVLARLLSARGHETSWWTSTFDHYGKRQRANEDRSLAWEGVTIRMLRSVGYKRNVSLRRFVEHRQIAQKFAAQARDLPRPDVIFASLPTIELSRAAVEFGREANVPVLLDIRDLWPDAIIDLAPRGARWLARMLMAPMSRSATTALRNCSGIVGISRNYLDWGLERAGRVGGATDGIFPLGYAAPRANPLGDQSSAEALASKGVDPGKLICWYVGSFGRQYDLGPVIEAAKRVAADGRRDVQFVISGDGELGAKWRQLAGHSSNIAFTGWIDGDQISWLRARAAVGLQPYVAGAPQGLANKLFEYISAGIPVLSSLSGENADLIANYSCGLTYRAGDGRDCYEKLCKMLDEPSLRARMGENGKDLFMKQFDSNTIFEGLAAHLETVARRP
jgi:glycosyltransferase involved in cell wall biosynthesis